MNAFAAFAFLYFLMKLLGPEGQRITAIAGCILFAILLVLGFTGSPIVIR